MPRNGNARSLPSANEVWGKVMFSLCLLQGGGGVCVGWSGDGSPDLFLAGAWWGVFPVLVLAGEGCWSGGGNPSQDQPMGTHTPALPLPPSQDQDREFTLHFPLYLPSPPARNRTGTGYTASLAVTEEDCRYFVWMWKILVTILYRNWKLPSNFAGDELLRTWPCLIHAWLVRLCIDSILILYWSGSAAYITLTTYLRYVWLEIDSSSICRRVQWPRTIGDFVGVTSKNARNDLSYIEKRPTQKRFLLLCEWTLNRPKVK